MKHAPGLLPSITHETSDQQLDERARETARFPYRELTLTWHVDPGHAWLQVHRETLEDFNLGAGDFSEFSYADSHYLYLEEDCDAGKFLRAVGDNAEFQFNERECDATFNVRALPRNR